MNPLLAELLEEHLAGRLPQAGQAQLAAALAADPALLAEVDAVVMAHQALTAWADLTAGERVAQAVTKLCSSQRASGLHALTRAVQRRVARPKQRSRPQSQRQRRRWWPLATIAAFATAAVAALLVVLVLPSTTGLPSRDGQVLIAGSTVEAGLLRWPDGSTVTLAPAAQARIGAGDLRLELLSGHADCSITPQGAGHFAIATPQGRAVVIGTRFRLLARPTSTWLAVDEGRVALAGNGDRLEVAAGTVALLEAGAAPRLLTAESVAWSDARPVGVVMLAESGLEGSSNPRGYGNERTWDVATPAGRAAVADHIAGRIDAATKNIRSCGGQGLIVWDVEGREKAGWGYLADPRRSLLAPEAVPALDAAFARVRAAGLAPGVLVATNDSGLDGVSDLVERLRWAQQRWDIGLAAINGAPHDVDLRLVAACMPTIRLITVDGHPRAREAGYAYGSVTAAPAPRSALLVRGDDEEAALAAALRVGALPLLPAWYDSPELDLFDRASARP